MSCTLLHFVCTVLTVLNQICFVLGQLVSRHLQYVRNYWVDWAQSCKFEQCKKTNQHVHMYRLQWPWHMLRMHLPHELTNDNISTYNDQQWSIMYTSALDTNNGYQNISTDTGQHNRHMLLQEMLSNWPGHGSQHPAGQHNSKHPIRLQDDLYELPHTRP